ncbi:MAG: hypothetical protein ACREC0_12350 [Methylocella sp.]
MTDNNQPADNTSSTSGNMPPSVNGQPPTKAHQRITDENTSDPKKGIGWDRMVELLFTFAIMAATAVNVCVSIRQ